MYPNVGGIEQITRNIANALTISCEYDQKIICFNETASDGDYICKREETVHDVVDGIEIIRCGCITKKASQSISLAYVTELHKVMEDFHPDIVIFHYPNPYQAAFLSKYLKRDIIFILYWHLDIIRQKFLGKLFHGQTIRLLKRADKIVATSPNYVNGSPYLSKYKEKCVVIPNCIDENKFQISAETQDLSNVIRANNKDKIICFAIGRHVPYKGFSYLIKASKALDDRYRIFIAGQGELTEQLRAEAKGDKKISFLGRLSDIELIANYMAMDIFCFPSVTKNEAFGIALAEGMYFGKPAVTFHIPGSGVSYVNLDGVTGFEVENRDSNAYADAIKRLGREENLRIEMGKNARERVIKLFSLDKFNFEIIDLLKKSKENN